MSADLPFRRSDAPQFGEWFTGIWASPGNPHRHGMYVETIRRSGRMNPGVHYRLTDGKGSFWEYKREDCERSGHEEDCASCDGPVPCDCGWTRHLKIHEERRSNGTF